MSITDSFVVKFPKIHQTSMCLQLDEKQSMNVHGTDNEVELFLLFYVFPKTFFQRDKHKHKLCRFEFQQII